jgi:uncharacterized protein YfaS (alpha-2-macroglobulin family)
LCIHYRGLVELLIIIAIIAVLITFLAPALQEARYSVGIDELMRARIVPDEAPEPVSIEADIIQSISLSDAAKLRIRKYFPETLLWQPDLITDEQGKAQLDLPLADSITNWRMNIDAVSAAGRLGSAETGIRVFQDFFIDLDLPVVLTQNDEISLPVTCYNYLSQSQTVKLNLEPLPWFTAQGPTERNVRLAPNEVRSIHFRIKAQDVGTHKLTVLAQGEKQSDAVRRSIRVRPDGSEIVDLHSGVLTRTAEHSFTLAPDAIDNSENLILKIYPTTFSEVLEGLENIFRKPYGCFEQTSSTTYPNVMALLYMQQTKQITPEIEVKARKFITAGYQRLLTFEVNGGGFDWFGNPPANEMLTAYGIMEFSDMAKVHSVDPAVIDRSCQWLLNRQKWNGAWSEPGRTESLQNVNNSIATTAYIVWALAEAGRGGEKLNRALNYLRQNVKAADDSYTLALAANALLTNNPSDPKGLELIVQLRSRLVEERDTAWIRSQGSGVFYSRGQCLEIESTALTALAVMKAKRHPPTVKKMLTWISQQKDQFGTFYSTQATILAMKALIAGAGQAMMHEKTSRITVNINDRSVGQIKITPETSDVLQMLTLKEHLNPGRNTIRLTQDQDLELPYQIVGSYWIPIKTIDVKPIKELQIEVQYDRTRLTIEDVLTCTVQVNRNGPDPVNMAIIDLGIPPGFQVLPAAFQRLVERRVLARYEITGNQCILYVRNIRPDKPLRFQYELKALYPIRAKVPPSGVYEYYQPENKHYTLPQEIVVLKKPEPTTL